MIVSIHPYRLIVIPLHSSITTQEQARAFIRPEEGFRKVILSTNIAESSITVPDIKYGTLHYLLPSLCYHGPSCDMRRRYVMGKKLMFTRLNIYIYTVTVVRLILLNSIHNILIPF